MYIYVHMYICDLSTHRFTRQICRCVNSSIYCLEVYESMILSGFTPCSRVTRLLGVQGADVPGIASRALREWGPREPWSLMAIEFWSTAKGLPCRGITLISSLHF